MTQLPFAKKQLGQHWLQDSVILSSMVEDANLTKKDTVLEIGPGTGTLTEELLKTSANIVALEYDKQRCLELQKKYKNLKKIEIVFGDIRTFNLTTLPKNYKIVANIPYYLTANLFRKLTDVDNKPSVAVLLVQKEVAERVVATKGQLSQIAIFLQICYKPKLGSVVPANLFTPPPKVDSQILVLDRLDEPKILIGDILTATLKAGFGEKRKKLRSSLASGLTISKSQAEQYLNQAGISLDARAQELDIDDWAKLADQIKQK